MVTIDGVMIYTGPDTIDYPERPAGNEPFPPQDGGAFYGILSEPVDSASIIGVSFLAMTGYLLANLL